ncbi:MAG: alcohol dehydrogenase catalytic domain-containing protein [Cyclobacteriaceae bacterium]|nr:alcohol dehydrogenase catalytic domain-containing protein [Cyclobacteriaceae bacterium]
MKALTFHGKEKIVFESIADPEILNPDDVIVKIKLTCICGSDLHVYYEHEKGLDHGTAMGHEFVGEVMEVGSNVKSFRAGDRVMSPFTTNCGKCFYCKIGLTCRCENGQLYGWVEKGRGLQGGQAEYVRVTMADATLEKIPEGVSLEEGLLLGDILSTGFFCAHQAEIKPTGVQAVVGCGPVGMMTIVGAREYGATKLFAIDSVEERLKMAEGFGAIPIDFIKQNPLEVIKEHNQGRGADAVMEVVGNGNAARLAYDILRPGGIISTVGVCNDQYLSFSPVEAYNKNITYKVGRCPAHFYMNKLIPIVQQKKYDITSILSHRMPLSEGTAGYDIFANKKDNCLKVVLEV